MEKKSNDLWNGGPWEQSSHPVLSALSFPSSESTPHHRPVLRVRRKSHTFLPFLCGVFVTVLVIGLSHLLPQLSESFLDPLFPPYNDGSENIYPDAQKTPTEMIPPTIPQYTAETPISITLDPPPPSSLSYTEIYEKCLPFMVSIASYGSDGGGTGTGIILTEDGYLLTNAHVVSGAEQVRVVTYKNEIFDASLVGFHGQEDLAVLKINANGLPTAEFGDSTNLRCGDPVAALGDALGYRSTITDGIISSVIREVPVDHTTMPLIQTSAAINFGSSGGALLNQYGQVVGITTIKLVAYDGSAEAMGFAIPSIRVQYVANQLIAGHEVRPGVFGFIVNTAPVPQGGLEIQSVDPRSDGAAKGIRPGDVLVLANGMAITSTEDLIQLKLTLGVGDSVSLSFRRDGALYTVDVILVDPELLS